MGNGAVCVVGVALSKRTLEKITRNKALFLIGSANHVWRN
jgi:hypothetical protein